MRNYRDDLEKADHFLKATIPLSLAIAVTKATFVRPVTERIVNSVESDRKRKLTIIEKEDFEKVIADIIANLPPSIFGLDFGWKPSSSEEVKVKMEELMTPERLEEITHKIVVELRENQSRISDYLSKN